MARTPPRLPSPQPSPPKRPRLANGPTRFPNGPTPAEAARLAKLVAESTRRVGKARLGSEGDGPGRSTKKAAKAAHTDGRRGISGYGKITYFKAVPANPSPEKSQASALRSSTAQNPYNQKQGPSDGHGSPDNVPRNNLFESSENDGLNADWQPSAPNEGSREKNRLVGVSNCM